MSEHKNPIFIHIKTGEDESAYYDVLERAMNLYGAAYKKEVHNMKKDGHVIGRIHQGLLSVKDGSKVCGFVCGELWYDGGKAIYFENIDEGFTRFDPAGGETIGGFIIAILMSKLKDECGPFHKLLVEKYYPNWEEEKRQRQWYAEIKREERHYKYLLSQIPNYWLITEAKNRGFDIKPSSGKITDPVLDRKMKEDDSYLGIWYEEPNEDVRE